MAGLNSVRFTCTSLEGTGKRGILKPDDNGYYDVVLGALNVFNSAGQYYVYEQARELFEDSSQFMRRVKRGVLKGEMGHPKPLPGMTEDQFMQRVLSIYEDNVSHHIKEVTLNFDDVKDGDGKPVIAIMGKVKGSGPHGAALDRSLANPDENVCFSIRAFTDDFRDRGLTKRVLKTIVTWDAVTEPGISVAEKYKAPSLESLMELNLSRGTIERSVTGMRRCGTAMESSIITGNELLKAMGWVDDRVNHKPHFLGW